jgi:hypothetical protein
MSPHHTTTTLAVIAATAAIAGCGGGGEDDNKPQPTYQPAAVVQCLRIERVPLNGSRPNGEITVKSGRTKRVYDKHNAELNDPNFPAYRQQDARAAARRFVRPDLAQEALKSGPGRAWAAYVPIENPGMPLKQFAGQVPGRSQVDLLFFGSPASAEDAEPGAGDQARALDLITVSDSVADVNKVRSALKAAGGPTVKRDGNLLMIWRTVPQPAEESTIKGCLDRSLKDEQV